MRARSMTVRRREREIIPIDSCRVLESLFLCKIFGCSVVVVGCRVV